MWKRRGSARVLAVAFVALLAALVLAPAASAASPADVCAEFPHKQTYVGELGLMRAPAWHYDRPVTIVYETDSCESHLTNAGRYTLSIAGSATVYEGLATIGRPLDERPFTSEIRADAADDKIGWPIKWWSCFDGSFSYVWQIEDVYVFSVTAEDGRWVMAQRDPASDDALARVANGCRQG